MQIQELQNKYNSYLDGDITSAELEKYVSAFSEENTKIVLRFEVQNFNSTQSKLKEIKSDKEQIVALGQYEEAARLRDSERQLLALLELFKSKSSVTISDNGMITFYNVEENERAAALELAISEFYKS